MSSSSYRNVLKATSVVGGGSLVTMLISMFRVKTAAILIGPEGIGLIGVYNTTVSLVSTVAGLGLGTSGVRQIAAAYACGDEERLARTGRSIRHLLWAAGLLGMVGMILGSRILSTITFGTTLHANSLAWLGIAILMANVALAQTCLLQGARRLKELAQAGIMGALAGTALSILCIFLWKTEGIIPGLILTGGSGLVAAWWFARGVPVHSVRTSWTDTKVGGAEMLRFGIPIMLSGLMSALCAYLITAVLARTLGLEGVGFWQAAQGLSSVLANFVLSAMGTDYFPRLTAVAGNHERTNEVINEQTEIALLLAVPGLAATIVFAPMVLNIFYSAKFEVAVDMLRWFTFGIFGRILSWPLGYVILANGYGKTFLGVETLHNLFYFAALLVCVHFWGLVGTGVAFVLLYMVVTVVNYHVANAISKARWTGSIKRMSIGFGAILGVLALNASFIFAPRLQLLSNILIAVLLAVYCLRRLGRNSVLPFRATVGPRRPNALGEIGRDSP